MNQPGTEDKHGPGVRLHPPIIYAISILTGVGLGNIWPWAMPFEIYGRAYGSCVLVIAIGIAGWALYEFHHAETDVRPDKPDSALITGGPFNYTRNPLYIVLSLVQITVAMWLNNFWVLTLLPASIFVITQYAISREELYLEKLFGQDYLDYKSRVRRWI